MDHTAAFMDGAVRSDLRPGISGVERAESCLERIRPRLAELGRAMRRAAFVDRTGTLHLVCRPQPLGSGLLGGRFFP